MSSNFCYFNGKILFFNKAAVSLDDLGLLRGYGVFEVLKTMNNKIFLYGEHFSRLKNSADYLGIKLPASKSRIKEIIWELIQKNKIKNASIRIVLTGGKSLDSLHFNRNTPNFFILVSEYKSLKNELYENGVKLISLDYQRNPTESKTTNYLRAIKIINERQKKEKFFEVLYVPSGNILECSTSNFFVFMANKLITSDSGILKGTTRNLVLKLAKKEFIVEEKPLKFSEISHATEAFISATNKDILPVVKIDKQIIGNGRVGENTKKLTEMFKNFMEKY